MFVLSIYSICTTVTQPLREENRRGGSRKPRATVQPRVNPVQTGGVGSPV